MSDLETRDAPPAGKVLFGGKAGNRGQGRRPGSTNKRPGASGRKRPAPQPKTYADKPEVVEAPPPPIPDAEVPPTPTPSGSGAGGGAPTTPAGAAGKNETAQAFAQIFVLLSILAAWATAQPEIAMTDAEAAAMAKPAARLFMRTKLSKMVGKHVVNSSDYMALTWATFRYLERVGAQRGRSVRNPGYAPSQQPSGAAPGARSADTGRGRGAGNGGAAPNGVYSGALPSLNWRGD